MTTIVRDLSRLAPEANAIGQAIVANSTVIIGITVANSVSIGNTLSAAVANVVSVTANSVTGNVVSFANGASRANVRFNVTSSSLEITTDGSAWSSVGGGAPGFLLMNNGII